MFCAASYQVALTVNKYKQMKNCKNVVTPISNGGISDSWVCYRKNSPHGLSVKISLPLIQFTQLSRQ